MDEFFNLSAAEAERPQFLIATVGAVAADGVTLIFAGESAPSTKKYKGNAALTLKAGDRVKLSYDSGTYLIDYVIGVPKSG